MCSTYKNVLIFVQTLYPGGAEKQAVILANSLADSFSVKLIVFYGLKTNTRITNQVNKNVELLLLHGNGIKRIIDLFNELKNSRPYILFNYLLLPNLLGGFISFFFIKGISIGGIRSSVLDKNKVSLNRLANNVLNKKTIFNNYPGFKKYTAKGFNKRNAVVIPNAIEIKSEFILREEKNVPNILSVGRFEDVKDYYTSLKAIKGLFDANVKFTYTIIGWGTLEDQIYQWIDEFKLPDSLVKIIINPPDINKYYFAADIYLQSSLFEGLSNTVLEAMSYSLPLIVTDVGDNNRLVSNGFNGFVVAPKDSITIEKDLKVLLLDHNLRIQYGKASYDYVEKNYSIDTMKKRYLKLISELNNDRKS